MVYSVSLTSMEIFLIDKFVGIAYQGEGIFIVFRFIYRV